MLDPWQILHQSLACKRPEFNSKVLFDHERRLRGILEYALENLPKLRHQTERKFDIGILESIFGKFHQHHSFNAVSLDWGFRVTEPQVTKNIAHLLDEGDPDIRWQRIRAFLKALKVPNIPPEHILRKAKVFAEKDRVDLEIWLPIANEGKSKTKYRPILIEAKFGHKLTTGQLRGYEAVRKKTPNIEMKNAHRIILGLTSGARKGLKGRQSAMWSFIAWNDLWLGYEKLRPRENNPNLTIFMNLLWTRIGALKP